MPFVKAEQTEMGVYGVYRDRKVVWQEYVWEEGKTRIFRTLLSLVKEFAFDPMIRARLRKGPRCNWGGTGQK